MRTDSFIHQATHPARELTLAGTQVDVRQLLLRDWPEMMTRFSRFLETLALIHEGPLTDAAVEADMPLILADAYLYGARDEVRAFLGYFCTLPDELDGWALADFEALWAAIYAEHARPFAFRRAEMARMGIFTALREIDWPSVISALSSTGPASTRATPDSPSPTPSPSPRPTPSTSAAPPTSPPTSAPSG